MAWFRYFLIAVSMLLLSFLGAPVWAAADTGQSTADRKSTRLNSSHLGISYAVFCLKKKKKLSHLTKQLIRITKSSKYGMKVHTQTEVSTTSLIQLTKRRYDATLSTNVFTKNATKEN